MHGELREAGTRDSADAMSIDAWAFSVGDSGLVSGGARLRRRLADRATRRVRNQSSEADVRLLRRHLARRAVVRQSPHLTATGSPRLAATAPQCHGASTR